MRGHRDRKTERTKKQASPGLYRLERVNVQAHTSTTLTTFFLNVMFVGQWDFSYRTVLCIHNTKADKVGKELNMAHYGFRYCSLDVRYVEVEFS